MAPDRRILIADDDCAFRRCVVELIGDLPLYLQILEAETGDEALEILRRGSIDLAVLDHHMPGMTGLEIISTLKLAADRTPSILLSGDASDAVRKHALHEGAHAVLRKPPEPRLLRLEVARALRIDAA